MLSELDITKKKNTLDVDCTYVIHVKKGYEDRKNLLSQQFAKHQISPEWMLDADLGEIGTDILEKYIHPGGELYPVRPITSCTLKHLLIIQQVVERNLETMLIFEDDVILDDDFTLIFNNIMKEYRAHKDWKEKPIFISLENSSHNYVPKSDREKDRYLYPAKKTRCAGAYVVNNVAAKCIIEHVLKHKCHLPIDWYYNYLIDQNIIEILWSHPTIVEQGSHNGKMASSVSKVRYGRWYKIQWAIKKFIKQSS